MPGLHHVEIWVAADSAAATEWDWLLARLGFALSAAWPGGATWDPGDGGAYVTLTTSPYLSSPEHDRRRAGVNHLAFRVGTRVEVDAVMAEASGHGWAELYAERYPHAGGPEHYAGWLESSDGFKAEIVATER